MGSYLPPPGTADGRFAPSPTGPLHLGNLSTALLAWLFARSARGAFYLRMEDLDAARVRPGAATGQLEDLHALGLDWDGPVLHQAQRLDLYRDAIGRLEAAGARLPVLLQPGRDPRRRLRAPRVGARVPGHLP